MKATTAIAIGFMNGDLSLTGVIKLTTDFLGRRLTLNEFNNIARAYNRRQQRPEGYEFRLR